MRAQLMRRAHWSVPKPGPGRWGTPGPAVAPAVTARFGLLCSAGFGEVCRHLSRSPTVDSPLTPRRLPVESHSPCFHSFSHHHNVDYLAPVPNLTLRIVDFASHELAAHSSTVSHQTEVVMGDQSVFRITKVPTPFLHH